MYTCVHVFVAKLISGPSVITLCLLRKGLFFFNSEVTSELAWQASLLRGSAVCRLRTGITGDCHHGQHLCGFWGPRLALVPTLTLQVLYPLSPLPSSTPTLSSPPPRSSFKEKEKKKKPFVKSQVSAPHLKFRPSSVIFQLGPFITCPCFLYLLFRG